MTKSALSSFFFFTVSLLLLLAMVSAGNSTSGLRYYECSPGDTVRECIKATVEEEEEDGVEAVVRRILQQRPGLGYRGLQGPAPCKTDIYGDCIGAANVKSKPCTYYSKCKRYPPTPRI